jgi:hypothetical protein
MPNAAHIVRKQKAGAHAMSKANKSHRLDYFEFKMRPNALKKIVAVLKVGHQSHPKWAVRFEIALSPHVST